MSYENDEDIDVLNELPSAHTQDYITTGEVPDAGSQHALKTANEALKSRLLAVTQDYEQLKANHRLLLRKSQKQQLGGTQGSHSLLGMPSSGLGQSLVSKGTLSTQSTDEGFGTGDSDASNSNTDHKIKKMESYYARQLEEGDQRIKELTQELTELQRENYRFMAQVNELKKKSTKEDSGQLKI